jgi:beta-lactamase regulating signal transducer with metallopeptidase domain
MLNSIVYVLAFAAALSVVAMCLEHLAVTRRQPRRFAWALAILCSALLPPLMILKASPDRAAVPAAGAIALTPPPATRDIANTFTAPEASPVSSAAAASENPVSDPTIAWQVPAPTRSSLLTAWAVMSGAMLAFVAGTGLLLRRRSASWQHTVIQGHEVLVSEDTGPALLGALQPRMVVPRWFMDEPADTQSLILEHEQQHIAARDPLLLRVAMLVAIAAPWNLPLWWQLRRLRLAIELDCDSRVMRGGASAGRYGEVLLEVTQRATAMPIGVIAMTEPVSALESRIRSLAPAPGRYAVLHGIGALLIALAGVAAAAALEAPAIQRAPNEPALRPAAPAAPMPPRAAAPAAPAAPRSAAQPAAPMPPTTQRPGATSVTPARPAVLAAAAPPPPRPPQPSTENPVGAEARPAPSAPSMGTLPASYGMELRDLIALAGKKFKKSFVVDPRMIRGTVDLGTLTMESLSYHAFLEILWVSGFAAVPSGDVVTIIPAQSARTVASPIFSADNIQGDDAEIVTVLIPVNGDPVTMANTVRTLVSHAGQVLPMPDGKTVLVVDKAGNVKRIAAVVQAVSKPQ